MDRLLIKICNLFKYIMVCMLRKIVGVILNLFPFFVAITNGWAGIPGLGNGHTATISVVANSLDIKILSNARCEIYQIAVQISGYQYTNVIYNYISCLSVK